MEGSSMSFVDDLNKKITPGELIQLEEIWIKEYVDNIMPIIESECWEHKEDHNLRMYLGKDVWEGNYILVPKIEDAYIFDGLTRSGLDKTATKPLDTRKMIKCFEERLIKLGFENFTVQMIPIQGYKHVQIGKTFFGNIKYKKVPKTDYKLYFELVW